MSLKVTSFGHGMEVGQRLTIRGDPWPTPDGHPSRLRLFRARLFWILRTPVFGWRSPKLLVQPRRVNHTHTVTSVDSATQISL